MSNIPTKLNPTLISSFHEPVALSKLTLPSNPKKQPTAYVPSRNNRAGTRLGTGWSGTAGDRLATSWGRADYARGGGWRQAGSWLVIGWIETFPSHGLAGGAGVAGGV